MKQSERATRASQQHVSFRPPVVHVYAPGLQGSVTAAVVSRADELSSRTAMGAAQNTDSAPARNTAPKPDGRELAAGDQTDNESAESKPLVHVQRQHRHRDPDDEER